MTMTYKPPGSRLSRLLYGLLAYTSLGIGIAAIFYRLLRSRAGTSMIRAWRTERQ